VEAALLNFHGDGWGGGGALEERKWVMVDSYVA
jgi:hypothetical protein